ncbi:hypothetical protein M8C21_002359 [Ambrosia artemisiifolia]|uniref:Uncharacterized protein n=1 Tax=Ambrosia artemisiifolia TaxID=4212 RepID=A0AAD5C1E7_AMBAR|nr:hypothetical protein M8C21_002359 [Ambrosia artemisiifolia]
MRFQWLVATEWLNARRLKRRLDRAKMMIKKKKCMKKQLKLQNPQIQVVQPLVMIKEKIRGNLVSWNYSTNSWMVPRLKSPVRIKANQVNWRGLTGY